MQNILLLNSENSIPDRTPAEFQTVWLQLPQSPRRSPGEVRGRGRLRGGEGSSGAGRGQGAQILYNYRKGAIRVAGESPDKKWIWCIEWWILKFLYWKRPRVSTTRDGCILFYSFVLYLSRIRIEVEIVVIIRNVNIQKFYLFGNIDFKILVFCPPDKAGFIWYEGELNAVYLIEVCFLQLFDFLF